MMMMMTMMTMARAACCNDSLIVLALLLLLLSGVAQAAGVFLSIDTALGLLLSPCPGLLFVPFPPSRSCSRVQQWRRLLGQSLISMTLVLKSCSGGLQRYAHTTAAHSVWHMNSAVPTGGGPRVPVLGELGSCRMKEGPLSLRRRFWRAHAGHDLARARWPAVD